MERARKAGKGIFMKPAIDTDSVLLPPVFLADGPAGWAWPLPCSLKNARLSGKPELDALSLRMVFRDLSRAGFSAGRRTILLKYDGELYRLNGA
jgi:hypothetical protein